jgi:anti-sigma B factor antagonist
MKFSVDKQEHYCVFSLLDARLTQENAPDLKTEFFLLFQEGIPNLVLDLSQVTFIESSGLSAVLRASQIWKNAGMVVVAGATSPLVRKLFEITRLVDTLDMTDTVEEGIELIYSQMVEQES